jgi:hypothetical protein
LARPIAGTDRAEPCYAALARVADVLAQLADDRFRHLDDRKRDDRLGDIPLTRIGPAHGLASLALSVDCSRPVPRSGRRKAGARA